MEKNVLSEKIYASDIEDGINTDFELCGTIASCYNACKAINTGNPLKVAEVLPDILQTLKDVMSELECYEWNKETFPVMNKAIKLLHDLQQ